MAKGGYKGDVIWLLILYSREKMIHTGALFGEKCGVYTRKEKNRNIHAREVAKTRLFQ